MKSSLNLGNRQGRSTEPENPPNNITKKTVSYFLETSYQNHQLSPAFLAIMLLILLVAGLAIFQIQATAQIPGLAIKLTESRQQSAEVAFKSRVLGAELASELVTANDDVHRISKSLDRSSKTNKVQSQIILYIPPPKSTFRQIFPRQYLPAEVIESMQRIEELGSVK
jgi:hypothetical protein